MLWGEAHGEQMRMVLGPGVEAAMIDSRFLSRAVIGGPGQARQRMDQAKNLL